MSFKVDWKPVDGIFGLHEEYVYPHTMKDHSSVPLQL